MSRQTLNHAGGGKPTVSWIVHYGLIWHEVKDHQGKCIWLQDRRKLICPYKKKVWVLFVTQNTMSTDLH